MNVYGCLIPVICIALVKERPGKNTLLTLNNEGLRIRGNSKPMKQMGQNFNNLLKFLFNSIKLIFHMTLSLLVYAGEMCKNNLS